MLGGRQEAALGRPELHQRYIRFRFFGGGGSALRRSPPSRQRASLCLVCGDAFFQSDNIKEPMRRGNACERVQEVRRSQMVSKARLRCRSSNRCWWSLGTGAPGTACANAPGLHVRGPLHGCGKRLRPFKRRASRPVQFNGRIRIVPNGRCGYLRFIARPVRLNAAQIFRRTFKPVVRNRSISPESDIHPASADVPHQELCPGLKELCVACP